METMLRTALPTMAALIAATLTVAAQPAPKSYAPVAIEHRAALDDANFVAFRTALAAAAKSRIYAALTPLVLTHGFFWGRDFGNRFDPRRPAVDNLAAAVALEEGNGAGWEALAAFAAEPAAEPLDSRPGVICAPARPQYDGVVYAKLLDVTYTSGIDWAYPRADETPVRATPQPGAAIVGALGLHFVRLLGFEGPDGEASPGRAQWARVAMPDGKTGFVAPGTLSSLTAERLCYSKDMVGGWHIAGYIGGGG